MKHLGNVKCADCGGSHDIYAGEGGLLGSIEKCPGPVTQGTPSGSQSTGMTDAVRYTENCINELKRRFEEGDWDQVRVLAEEATFKLSTVAMTASEITKP